MHHTGDICGRIFLDSTETKFCKHAIREKNRLSNIALAIQKV